MLGLRFSQTHNNVEEGLKHCANFADYAAQNKTEMFFLKSGFVVRLRKVYAKLGPSTQRYRVAGVSFAKEDQETQKIELVPDGPEGVAQTITTSNPANVLALDLTDEYTATYLLNSALRSLDTVDVSITKELIYGPNEENLVIRVSVLSPFTFQVLQLMVRATTLAELVVCTLTKLDIIRKRLFSQYGAPHYVTSAMATLTAGTDLDLVRHIGGKRYKERIRGEKYKGKVVNLNEVIGTTEIAKSAIRDALDGTIRPSAQVMAHIIASMGIKDRATREKFYSQCTPDYVSNPTHWRELLDYATKLKEEG